MPLSVVESRSFRTFVRCLDPRYRVPSRKQFSSVLLKRHYNQLMTIVKDSMKHATRLSITMDMWTNRQMRSFTWITGHYIFNWKLESVLLACDRCRGRHTAEKIYQEYENTVLHFDIADKVRHIVTDTASNMVKAFKLPSYENEKSREASGDSEFDSSDEEDNSDDDSFLESATSDDPTMLDILTWLQYLQRAGETTLIVL